jgi:hypothetical protein
MEVPSVSPGTRTRARPMMAVAVAGVAVLLAGMAAAGWQLRGRAAPVTATVLTPVASIALPGDTSRYDYASLDPGRHLLFIAHLGAGQIVEVDTVARRVVRVIDHVDGVHGVLVVPSLRRVFATATDLNQVLTLDRGHRGRPGTRAHRGLPRRAGLRPHPQPGVGHQ